MRCLAPIAQIREVIELVVLDQGQAQAQRRA